MPNTGGRAGQIPTRRCCGKLVTDSRALCASGGIARRLRVAGEVLDLLNAYYTQALPPIHEHDGFVDKVASPQKTQHKRTLPSVW